MAYNTTPNIIPDQLDWPSYIPMNADKLIIGTFPTIKCNREFEFFYPNYSNPFWTVLSIISGEKLLPHDHSEAVINRKQILNKLKLGITDMGHKILRHGNTSADGSIFPVEFTDIFKILDENQGIKKLIFTSSSGGNSVEAWFRSYCSINGIKFPRLKGKNPKRISFLFNDRKYEIVAVHSSSKAAARKLEELEAMYHLEILENF